MVSYGDGRVSYVYVPFVEDELTGIELLRRSGIPLTTVSFGGLGQAVCTVGGTGCGLTECRQRVCQTADRSSPFWQYVRQTAPGEWSPVALGASHSTVRDGVIDGWVWTSGQPSLPGITMTDLLELAGAEAKGAGATGDVPAASLRTVGGVLEDGGGSGGVSDVLRGGGVLVAVGSIGGLILWWLRHAARRVGP
ncbi:MAG: hypothetical protein H0W06_13595 [Chloroflexia bacterium]|nr:hypothetical protein [Chloroflexia bacterium]